LRREADNLLDKLSMGMNSSDLMYVNVPVFFEPERLARFSQLAKSIGIAMTLERSQGLQAKDVMNNSITH
jgi:hypothetical protein